MPNKPMQTERKWRSGFFPKSRSLAPFPPSDRPRSVLPMIEHSSTIEAAFQIEDRGCVVVPGIPRDADSHVKVGDHVYILGGRRGCIDTVIRGIEMISARPRLNGFPILLPKTITKEDIPIGASLHIVEQSPQDGAREKSAFNTSDRVRVRTNQRNKTQRAGVIEQKVWHHKYQLWYYYIRDANGRKVSKRYTAADLLLIAKSTEPIRL